MNALARSVNVHETAPASPGRIMAVAASVAQELSERWPFAVVRLRVALSGPLCRQGAWDQVERSVTLGLSGIVDAAAPARVEGVLGLQARMMAIRLSGRKLVAFHPARDLHVRRDAFGAWVDGLRVDAIGADGGLLGSVERVL